MQLTGLNVAAFMRDHWQRQPLLLRGAWAQWTDPLSADELAGLACEDGVEGRLVVQAPDGWTVEHGPFPAARFARPETAPWTLLVNAVDHHVPQVQALLEAFRFIPDWRIDDVMVSYASDGGGVGPHFDQYDVFLIQGSGQRRWQIGQRCDACSPLLPHDDLRLLADFTPHEEYLLEAGDMLYLPPGVAHNGIAVGDDCMTYSVGFRAPARSELIAHWCDHVLGEVADDDLYSDPGLAAQDNPGEITSGAVAALHAFVLEKLQDRAAFGRWFGEYSSVPKYPDVDWSPEAPLGLDQVEAALAARATLCRNPASRFAFIREGDGTIVLFADGVAHECAGPAGLVAQELCRNDQLTPGEACRSAEGAALVLALCNQGSLALDGEDEADSPG